MEKTKKERKKHQGSQTEKGRATTATRSDTHMHPVVKILEAPNTLKRQKYG
jgi:hypothetical protein